jgi:hypothetical protein
MIAGIRDGVSDAKLDYPSMGSLCCSIPTVEVNC